MSRAGGAIQLETVQTCAAIAAATSLVLGFFASIGLHLFPPLAPGTLWPVAVLLAVCGVGGGVATVERANQIDRVRWEVAQDPLITSGEREYAHREAERERRWAGTVFFATPVAVAYWAAFQLPPCTGLAGSALLAAFPLVGYLLGLLAAHRRWRRRPPE